MSDDEYHLVTDYNLKNYPCGLKAGERLRLIREIVEQNHDGTPTGTIHSAGEIWTVLPGVEDEPEVIWLLQPDGSRHTWDGSIFETFERTTEVS